MTHKCPGLPPLTFNGENCGPCQTKQNEIGKAQLGAYALLAKSQGFEVTLESVFFRPLKRLCGFRKGHA